MDTPRGPTREHSKGHSPSPARPRRSEMQPQAKAVSSPTQKTSSSLIPGRGVSPFRAKDNGRGNCVDVDVNNSILRMLYRIFGEDSDQERVFISAPHSAPITKQSLSELDIGSIINNSKLRHDVCFDRELHFRPNMDGERGHRKRSTQILYWKAITVELHLVFHVLQTVPDGPGRADLISESSERLRAMFKTVKEILRNLVPEKEQSDVDEHLDVEMIMQEISWGVCNFVSIASWMAQLLKRHCAPMRDELVDKMVEKVGRQTPEMIATGLEDLFTVLEAMKLDVANHQIRHLRALLIEDAINFERKYHFSRIRKHRYECRNARRWFTRNRDSLMRVPMAASWPNRDVEAFVMGFLRLLLPTTDRLPDTFLLDMDRIRQLKEDIDENLRETICCRVLQEVMEHLNLVYTPEHESTFRQRMQSICGSPRPPRWHLHALDDIACEIVRFTLQVEGSTTITNSDLQDMACEMLSARLWAIVRARYVHDHSEQEWPDQARVQLLGEEMYNQLFDDVFRTVEEHLSNSPFDIFLTLVPPPTPPPVCPLLPTAQPTCRLQDLVRRAAHIAILHWRTWENLVYNNTDFDRETQSCESSLPKMPATAPENETHVLVMGRVPKNTSILSVHTEVDTTGDGTIKAPAG